MVTSGTISQRNEAPLGAVRTLIISQNGIGAFEDYLDQTEPDVDRGVDSELGSNKWK